MCLRGSRCHYRHDEHRPFSKIHKHFYLVHIKALPCRASDIIDESHGPDSPTMEELQIHRMQPRLKVFRDLSDCPTNYSYQESASSSGFDTESDAFDISDTSSIGGGDFI